MMMPMEMTMVLPPESVDDIMAASPEDSWFSSNERAAELEVLRYFKEKLESGIIFNTRAWESRGTIVSAEFFGTFETHARSFYEVILPEVRRMLKASGIYWLSYVVQTRVSNTVEVSPDFHPQLTAHSSGTIDVETFKEPAWMEGDTVIEVNLIAKTAEGYSTGGYPAGGMGGRTPF